MTVRDPVCGMQIDSDSAAATAVHDGVTYYFCAPGCRAAFQQDPERYLGAAMADDGAHHHHHGQHG